MNAAELVPNHSAPGVVVLTRHLRGFPMCDGDEAARALGFVRFSRTVATIPLAVLGVLSVGASLAAGLPIVAVLSGVTSALILGAIWHDTRLTTALDRLQQGDVDEAKSTLLMVAEGRARSLPDRQRARTYLAAIGWIRGDHEEALRWTEARLHAMKSVRTPVDDRFFAEATRVQLLALLGQRDEARTALESVTPAPDASSCRAALVVTRLLVAFATDDVEPVRADLGDFESLLEDQDDASLGLALLVWAYEAAGQPNAAEMLYERVTERIDRALLVQHLPALADQLDRREPVRRYG